MINRVHDFLLQHISWIGVDFIDPSASFEEAGAPLKQVRVLDYACGPGTITNILVSHATDFVGVDLSDNMVKAYNSRFAPSSDPGDREALKAHAVVGDLLLPSGPSPALNSSHFFDFDLVVVGFGFHHFHNLSLAAERLASRLKPGGVLLIVDFVKHRKYPGEHDTEDIIAHQGFGEEEVQRIFGGAGLLDVGVVRMEGMIEMKKDGDNAPGQKREVFMAKGRKPM